MFPAYAALSRCEWLIKLSFFFARQRQKAIPVYPLRPTMKRNFLSTVSSFFSSSLSLFLSCRFCASCPMLFTPCSLWTIRRTSKDYFSSKQTHRRWSPRRLPSIALHTNDELQISIRAGRAWRGKRLTVQRVAGKLFASRRAQKANLRMRCAIALMPVRPAGPSLDFEQV